MRLRKMSDLMLEELGRECPTWNEYNRRTLSTHLVVKFYSWLGFKV